jgi:hypothetical protein
MEVIMFAIVRAAKPLNISFKTIWVRPAAFSNAKFQLISFHQFGNTDRPRAARALSPNPREAARRRKMFGPLPIPWN